MNFLDIEDLKNKRKESEINGINENLNGLDDNKSLSAANSSNQEGSSEKNNYLLLDNVEDHLEVTGFKTTGGKRIKNRRNRMLLNMIVACLISSLLGGSVVGAYFGFVVFPAKASDTLSYSDNTQASDSDLSKVNSGMLSNISIESQQSVVSTVASEVGPSVVGIKTTYDASTRFGTQKSIGEGSGIIYTSDGYIITNYHVIEGAVDTRTKKVAEGGKIEVVLPNQKEKSYEAEVAGYDSRTDIAVIKISAGNLPSIALGDSDSVKVGEPAIAIGNPGGLEYMGSVTMGIISGLNRTIEIENGRKLKLIQTDAAINPGNSGGALVNSKGQVIGINTIKISAEGFEGIGFAIPINTVKQIADSLIDYKYVKGRPYLGISVSQISTDEYVNRYNLPQGLYLKVEEVIPMGAAFRAGIKTGDIILKFDGQKVSSYEELENIKNTRKPGDTAIVEIQRAGKTQSIKVKLEEDKNN